MTRLIFAAAFLFSISAFAENTEVKIACKAAMAGMPNGNGATVYHANGRTLTNSAGQSGATWYYANGRTLTSSMSVPGATFYHSNGRTFSSSTGQAGATWYYDNGRTMTSSGPALTAVEMAELACELLQKESSSPQ